MTMTSDEAVHAIQQAAEDLRRLRRWIVEAVDLLDEIAEHFDDESDCEIDEAGYHPNQAMRFKVKCDELTERAPK